MKLLPTDGSSFQRPRLTLLSRHLRKNLSVPLVWLPSCAWLMTRLLIDNPYTWNGRPRAHWGLQKINTIEKNQQDRTDGLRTIPIGKRRRRYRAQLRPHRTGSLDKS